MLQRFPLEFTYIVSIRFADLLGSLHYIVTVWAAPGIRVEGFGKEHRPVIPMRGGDQVTGILRAPLGQGLAGIGLHEYQCARLHCLERSGEPINKWPNVF